MDELKDIIAKNLQDYRKSAGFTQQELADKLNYSDKAISKWERGEGTPDVFVLDALAKLYGVTVNDFLKQHVKPIKTQSVNLRARRYVITALSAGLVWLVATVLMVVFSWIDPQLQVAKYAYVSALPVCAIVLLVFACIWGKLWEITLASSAVVWMTCVAVNTFVPVAKSWLFYLIGAGVQTLVLLWCVLRYLKKRSANNGKLNFWQV